MENPPSSATIIIIGQPPPFPAPPSSANLSALEFIIALIAIISIPALIYTFLFSVKCPLFHRRHHDDDDERRSNNYQLDQASDTTSEIITELSSKDPLSSAEAASGDGGLRFKREAHVTEMGSECPVCLSVFTDGEEIRQLSACKHAFHTACIDMWLSSHSNCPICRALVVAAAAANKRPNNDGRINTGGRSSVVRSGNGYDDDDQHQGMPDASSMV